MIPENSDDSASGDESQNTTPKKSRATVKPSISETRRNIKAKAMGANVEVIKNVKHLDDSKKNSPLQDQMKQLDASTIDSIKNPKIPIKIEFDEDREKLKLRIPKKNYIKLPPKLSKSWHVVTTVTSDNGPGTDEFMIRECDDDMDNQCNKNDDRLNESAGLSFNIDLN